MGVGVGVVVGVGGGVCVGVGAPFSQLFVLHPWVVFWQIVQF